tara:strand:+ start:412 stop:690 length:279 start_codon:yes stop_codon:yes gene_type:complete
MKNEKRFKSGDKVTYKSVKDCTSDCGSKGQYYYDGKEQDGFVGEIISYGGYNEDMDCWKIYVTNSDGYRYTMLECEFVEYDKQPTNELFPIY